MTSFCLCKHKDCEKSSMCKRYLTKESEMENSTYIRFENICGEKNNWKWLMETKQEVVVKEGDGK